MKSASVQKTRLWLTPTGRAGFIQDRRLRADMLFIRTQSVIGADGFSSAQNRNFAMARDAIQVAEHG
jgi:hypothetical protein